jgi:hypothetical protein
MRKVMSSWDRRERERGLVDWGRVADGVGFAGFGVFLLLSTVHGLPPGFWLDALSFWPVLLVSAGIRIIFDRSPLPWGALLGPLVVIGTLCWLAWGSPPQAAPPGEWHAVSAPRPPGVERLTLRATSIGGRLEIEARPLGPDLLARGRSASRRGRAVFRDTVEDHEVKLRLEGRQGGGVIVVPGRKELWQLAVADDVPLRVDIDCVMVRSDLRLEHGRVSGVEAKGPFQATELRLPAPHERVGVHLAGPFGSFTVVVPEGVPVHVQGPDAPFNLIFRGPARDRPIGDEPGYEIRFDGVFCSLSVEEGPPAAAPGPPPPAEALPAAAPASPAEAPPHPPAEAPR